MYAGAFIGGEPKQTFPAGRECDWPGGCKIKLSIYNSGTRCSLHGTSRVLPQRGKKAKR